MWMWRTRGLSHSCHPRQRRSRQVHRGRSPLADRKVGDTYGLTEVTLYDHRREDFARLNRAARVDEVLEGHWARGLRHCAISHARGNQYQEVARTCWSATRISKYSATSSSSRRS